MREAYFEVGEEVILVSKHNPLCNGEAIVLKAVYGEKWDYNTNKDMPDGWRYELTITVPEFAGLWDESALRKKHKPSEFTFEQLIKQEVPA